MISFNSNTSGGKDQNGKGKEGAYPQSGLSAWETSVKKDMAIPGNQTTGIPA